MDLLWNYLYVVFVSMLPIVELRGAIPIGLSMNLPVIPVLIVAIIGNMIPVPFIIFFIRRIFEWMKKHSEFLSKVALKMEEKAEKKSHIIKRYASLGLLILVAIPLPGTGAWTGSLVAAMFDLPPKRAFVIIFAGVVLAGLIITFGSYAVMAIASLFS